MRIVVEDQDGKPLPGVYVRLTLPDQTTEDHRSLADGVIYTDQLTPGQCKVELPELDKDSWSLKT